MLLTRDVLEAKLRALDPDRGRAIYLAYGSVREAIAALRVLAFGFGVGDDAVRHAERQIRLGARDANRIPMPRALSR